MTISGITAETASSSLALSERVDDLARQTGMADGETWGILQQELQALRVHHPESYDHSLRLGIYVVGTLEHEGYQETGQALVKAALHDIGKLDVDYEALSIRGRQPTTVERIMLERHVETGFRRLEHIDIEAAFVAGGHHRETEGYGIDLTEEARRHEIDSTALARIASMTRLVTLVDYFDAAITRDDRVAGEIPRNLDDKYLELRQVFPDATRRIDWLFANRIT